MPFRHGRKNSKRLKGYDYSLAGVYFVTIVVKNRECVLGVVEQGVMIPSPPGKIVRAIWDGLTDHYPNVRLDAFCIMPDHVHGIIVINNPQAGKCSPTGKNYSLSEIVRGFKTFSSRRINEYRQTPGVPFWQRGFYDHVIRTHAEHMRMAAYICSNPRQWLARDRVPGRFLSPIQDL